ncbi:MAG: DUF3108 domain-containing protein [Candidatus Omnitrophota bacterium]
MKNISLIFMMAVSCLTVFISDNHASESVLGIEYNTPLPFEKNERLTYDVKYKGLRIGEAILDFRGEEELRGEKLYHVTFFTKAASFKDTEEIFGDMRTFLPKEVRRMVKKKIGFNDSIIETYDQKDFRVDITSKSNLRTKKSSIKKDSPIHNAILLVYFCRAKADFKEKEKFHISLPTLDFIVSYKGKEAIETPMGKYAAHAFISDPPHFKLYLADDKKRTPLLIQNPGVLGYSLIIRSSE